MYTLISTTDSIPLYAIIQFSTHSWGPCDNNNSNWFDSIAKAISFTFYSGAPFMHEKTSKQIQMAHFPSIEAYCTALCEHPSYVSPKIICHFESPDSLFNQSPELFI